MTLTILLFAQAKDLAETARCELELPAGATVADLRESLLARFPRLQPLSSRLLIAVNSEYVAEHVVLSPGSEVACFPPVSGG